MKTKVLLSLLLIISMTSLSQAQQLKQVKSIDAVKMVKADSKLIILDVRTADEYKEGHIKGAINIDIRQNDALAKIDKLDHGAKYIVHCRTNHRSKTAVDHMMVSGFKNIYQMTDGFSGWSENGLPVAK